MTAALVATAAISVGSVARTLGLSAAVPFIAYLVGLGVPLAAAFGRAPSARPSARAGRALVALAVVAAVADRHLFVSSQGIAPDDVLAALVVVGAVVLPSGARWSAAGAGAALAAYVLAGGILLAAYPYHSDAVVATHGGAELVLQGRHPYADFDMVERLGRFGLDETYATALEDGSRLRSLNYPVLSVLAPAPLVAAGLRDVRFLYLAEVLALFAAVVLSVPAPWRAAALAACIGDLVVLDQFVLAGVDPLWALLIVAAYLARERRWSAILIGLAVADRQQAWLIAPFLIVWAGQRWGPREAAWRAALAAGVAVAVHLPFLVTAPVAVLHGVTDVVLLPLLPRGIGPSGLEAADLLPRLPRLAYLGAAGAAYLAAMWAFATRRARGPGAAIVLPLLPLWLAWRALQSYFAFIPLFLLTDRRDA